MPVYKGNTEVTSGSLKKGAVSIENGYKETTSFYVNETTIILLFVDSVSGATLSSTTASVQTGVPGTSFSTITRTLTANSGRVITSASVSESGDTNNNVSASISSSGGSSRTLTVNGTYPTQNTTVTITVSGTTVADQPNLIVSISQDTSPNFSISTENGGAIGSYSWSFTTNCPGGVSTSGSGSTSSNSTTVYSQVTAATSYPSCGSSCSYSVSVSASGYDSGGGSNSLTGSYPTFTPVFQNHTPTSCSCSCATLYADTGCSSTKSASYTNCAGTGYPTNVNTAGVFLDGSNYELVTWYGTHTSGGVYNVTMSPLTCSSLCFYYCNNGADGTGGCPY